MGTSSAFDTNSNSLLQLKHDSGPAIFLSNGGVDGGELLGSVVFGAAEGNGYNSASIAAYAVSDFNADDYPSRLVFSTTADGSSTPTERLRINSSGSAEFSGSVDIGSRTPASASGSGHRFFTNSTYSALFTQASSSASDFTTVYRVDKGTDLGKITFTANGAAAFAGNLDCGNWKATNNSEEGARIYSVGAVQVNRTSAGGAILAGRLNGVVTSQITADGNATFAGPVEGSSYLAADRGPISNLPALIARKSGVDHATIYNDGNAEFAGNVNAGSFNLASGSASGARLQASGAVYAQRASSDGNSFVFRGHKGTAPTFEVRASGDTKIGTDVNSSGGQNILLNADGSAEFASRVEVTTADPNISCF